MKFDIYETTNVPLGILSRVINAHVIRHESRKYYELDLSLFLHHYRAIIKDEELAKAKSQMDLVRSKWIECVAALHEDIDQRKRKRKKEEVLP